MVMETGAAASNSVPERPHAPSELEINRRKTRRALPALLTVFTLGSLLIQAFNLVFQNIGDSLGMAQSASLISTLPGIVLGIVCMLYGTLCDFVSPKRMTMFGMGALILGSLLGFFGASSFWMVLIGRMIQVAGAQVSGSVFVVMSVKFLPAREKAVYLGIYNAIYYLAAAIGVFAGGFITSFHWKYLFLVPLIAVAFLPTLIRNTPDVAGMGEKIDVAGITLFAIFAGLIAIFFSFQNPWLLLATAICGVLLGIWIAKAPHPFIGKDFLRNKAFMAVLLLQFVFFFFNFAAVPIYNVIGENLYGLDLRQISIYLTVVYVVATVIGIISGPLVNIFGRYRTLLLSALCMVVGFAGSAVLIGRGFVVLTVLACVFIAGVTACYTPIYDAASDALPVSENGRGIGILDLMLNISSSLGLAVYSALISSDTFQAGGIFGVEPGAEAATSNMFWFMAAVSLLAVVLVVVFRKYVTVQRPGTTPEPVATT
ncbi:MFS transporter [Actinobaculum suis]|uniref:MFS transporter n=1 Tax=Actinobaculum suis TaxID=1657 RepID=UPI00066FE446|nr:MFS transporter [Actinobaculum suis]KMY23684.1 MFS transporter [Actinobaculum suis]